VTDADRNSTYGGWDRLFRHCSQSPHRLRWPWVVGLLFVTFWALFFLLSINT